VIEALGQGKTRPYAVVTVNFQTYGFGAIVMAAHFPLFALAELEERFFPGDLGYAGGRPGDPLQHVLSGVTLTYAGPSYERITGGNEIFIGAAAFGACRHLTSARFRM
jgi:hypothetical protein